MNKTKNIVVTILTLIVVSCCIAFASCSCGAAKKYAISATPIKATAEAGTAIDLPKPIIKNTKREDVSATEEYIVTAVAPDGESAYVDESDSSVKRLEVETVGDYTVTYTLLEYEDVSVSFIITGVDTEAPVITKTIGYISDAFLGDKVTIPMLETMDASGIDNSKTEIIVKEKVTNTIITPEADGFIANSLNGYTISCKVVDKAGLEATRELDVRVTEKWLSTDTDKVAKGKELVTFAETKIINNVKSLGDRPSIEFALAKAGEIPSGSNDGKALKLSLTSGKKRERRSVRVWLPKPILLSEFSTIKTRVWVDESIDENGLWIYNEDEASMETGSWSAVKDPKNGDLVYGNWSVCETSVDYFLKGGYKLTDTINYIDYSFHLESGNKKLPVQAYIDEIYYDSVSSAFVDNVLADNVALDFDEAGDGYNRGYVETLGYEDMVKYRVNETNASSRRSRISFVDVATDENTSGKAGAFGKAMRIDPKMSGAGDKLDSNMFVLLPKGIPYDGVMGYLDLNIYVPDENYNILIRGYDENGSYHKLSQNANNENVLTANAWNRVKVPMSLFAKDIENDKFNNTKNLFAIYLQFYDNGGSNKPCYIDEIAYGALTLPAANMNTNYARVANCNGIKMEAYDTNGKVVKTMNVVQPTDAADTNGLELAGEIMPFRMPWYTNASLGGTAGFNTWKETLDGRGAFAAVSTTKAVNTYGHLLITIPLKTAVNVEDIYCLNVNTYLANPSTLVLAYVNGTASDGTKISGGNAGDASNPDGFFKNITDRQILFNLTEKQFSDREPTKNGYVNKGKMKTIESVTLRVNVNLGTTWFYIDSITTIGLPII